MSWLMQFEGMCCYLHVGTMPLWLSTIGESYAGEANVEIPYGNMFVTLAMLIGPLMVGILLQYFLPKVGCGSFKLP